MAGRNLVAKRSPPHRLLSGEDEAIFMIVRYESDGSIVTITQNDHALVAGLLAANWGNSDFAKPRPYESVVRATTFHDKGWIDYETSPRLNPDGKTPNYRDGPRSTIAATGGLCGGQAQLDVWN